MAVSSVSGSQSVYTNAQLREMQKEDERRKAEERSVPCAGRRDVRHHAGGSGGVPAAPPGRWRWEGFSEACDDAKQSPRRKTDRRGQR